MSLIKFEQQVGSTAIRANDLDRNFARLQPQPNGTYGINQTANGWSLDIFPTFPAKSTQALALTYVSGGLQWRQTIPTPPGGGVYVLYANGGLISWLDFVAITNSVSDTVINNVSNTIGITNPPNASAGGVAGWRQVQRCDGQTMYVWGTAWE